MDGTVKFMQDVWDGLRDGDLPKVTAAVVAGYADATEEAVSGLKYLASMQASVSNNLGDRGDEVLAAMTPEQVAEMDAMEERLDAALRELGR